MYQCSKCGKKITEFDVNFSKNLFGEFDKKNNCKCAQCIVDINKLAKSKPKTIFYLLPYIIIIGLVIEFSFFISMEETPLFDAILMITVAISIPIYIWSIVKAMGDMGIKYDEGYDVGVYKTTYDSSSNSFSTSKGTTTYYTEDNSVNFFKGVFYPVWGIFALITKNIRYKKFFTKEVRRAYEKAIRETESIAINKYDLKRRREKNYEEKCRQIKNKYGYLGDKDIIDKKIDKLPKPYVTLKSNKGNYYKWISGRGSHLKPDYLLLDSANNERIYNGVYFYYTDTKRGFL